MTDRLSIGDLGWRSFFDQQLEDHERKNFLPARVMSVLRDRLEVKGNSLDQTVSLPSLLQSGQAEERPTVGDWILVRSENLTFGRLLTRQSLFKRRAPGAGRDVQLIAANVDTVFIVSSCNQDFNLARLERFLVLAREADVWPVLVLTKADLCDDPLRYEKAALGLQSGLLVEVLNALDPGSADNLKPFCGKGQTVAFMGSSGVGKSTLINTLRGQAEIATQDIREDDARGRHTTTARTMHRLADGGWLLDTPGMREIQLTDVEKGLAELFDDIEQLVEECRFSDCTHISEPGCRILAAIASGELEPSRFERWKKLCAEERYNRETLAERRSRNRDFGKLVRNTIRNKKNYQRS